MALLECDQTLERMLANLGNMLQQSFFLDNIQHSQSCCAGDWISPESVEVHHSLAEVVDQICSRHHGADRMSVAHGFTHGDNIRNNTDLILPPHMSGSTEA
ncbi:hypothetical protein D3C80_1330660 [compost metagenome]